MNTYKVTYRRIEKSYSVTGMLFIDAESETDVLTNFQEELSSRLAQNPHNCEIIKIAILPNQASLKHSDRSKKSTFVDLKNILDRALSGYDPFYHAAPGSDQDAVNQWCVFIRNNFHGDDQKQKIEQYLADIERERPSIIQTYEKFF